MQVLILCLNRQYCCFVVVELFVVDVFAAVIQYLMNKTVSLYSGTRDTPFRSALKATHYITCYVFMK